MSIVKLHLKCATRSETMDIKDAKSEILRQASQHGNQVCKLKSPDGDFVKVKHGFNQPDELRRIYLDALNALLLDGSVKHVFSNRVLELYEAKSALCQATTLLVFKHRIMSEFQSSGRVYKIHGSIGEFVQLGAQSCEGPEFERILYIEALGDLLHRGVLNVSHDSPDMTTYVIPCVTNKLEYNSYSQNASSKQAAHDLRAITA